MMNRLLLWVTLCFSVSASAEMVTVPSVDLSRYAGTWYQISRNILPFETDCLCARQILSGRADGTIGVYNSCNNLTVDGPLREISGFATNDDPASNSKFTVDFGFPRKGTYWIIGLDSDYRYAVVSEPTGTALYILSKTPSLDPALYQEALATAARQVRTDRLVTTLQNGCTYPPKEL